MKKYLLGLIVVAAFAACTSADENKSAAVPAQKGGDFFNGSWTYRSLLNDTAWQMDFDSLQFAAAIIDLKTTGKDSLTGLIYWAQNPYQGLKLSGKWYYQDTVACYTLTGVGDSTLGTAGWQYAYQGYVVPHWSFGVNQADVLVGSVARVKPHSGEPAGVVASTYMVRRGK